MANSSDWSLIANHIYQVTGQTFNISSTHSISGGCINSAYLIADDDQQFFVKLNEPSLLAMFEAEYSGLKEIADSLTVKVPQPVASGCTDNYAYLILEYIRMGSSSAKSDAQLGEQLAAMHQLKFPFYGWQQNNTIGSTQQVNTQSNDWVNFWATHRLGFQLKLAQNNGYGGHLISSGEQLLNSLSVFFADYYPHPSLLHGDLWGGNAAVDSSNTPFIFDPACYYGDRETDIAMTELFGGFDSHFYSAYNGQFPLDAGYSVRKKLYNLYHILNHLNLFGSGYQQQAQSLINALLAEI